MTGISGISSTPATRPADPAIARANNALKMILTSTDVEQALANQSSIYVPPNSKKILSVLWAMFDTNGKSFITEEGVQQAVLAEGGKPSDATALWAQMDPTHKGSLSAGDFITNAYLLNQVPVSVKTVLAAVKNIQQANNGKSNSILDGFSDPNASVLSLSFNGSSPIGGPGSDYRKINIFL